MIRDEDGQLTGYVYIDLKGTNYGGFVDEATRRLKSQIAVPASYGYKWSGEYEFELRAKQRLKLILPIVFFMIFLLLYMVFRSVAEAVVLIVPTIYAMTGGLLLQWLLGYNFSVAVWVGYIALFGIAVETGVVMVVYLHASLGRRLQQGKILSNADVEEAVIEGAVKRFRPKLMTVIAVLASLAPILWEFGIRPRCHEADCRAHCGRHDHLNHPRLDPGASLLRHDERARATNRQATSSSCNCLNLNLNLKDIFEEIPLGLSRMIIPAKC